MCDMFDITWFMLVMVGHAGNYGFDKMLKLQMKKEVVLTPPPTPCTSSHISQ